MSDPIPKRARAAIPDSMRDAVAEATQRVAAPLQTERARTESAFIFRLSADWYALPTSVCERVVDESRTHSVPHRGTVLAGLGNIAGDLLPVVSLAALLGVAIDSDAEESRRTLLFAWRNSRFAFPVTAVAGIYRYHADERRPVPSTLTNAAACTVALLEWNGHSVGMLDPARVYDGILKGIA